MSIVLLIHSSIFFSNRNTRACARDIYLSVNFPTQNYLLFVLVFSGDSKPFFQLFQFTMKLIHLHYNWQQKRIVKVGEILQAIPT